MIVENTLRARGLAPLSFFSWTPFGFAVLATGIAFMLVGRPLLSKQRAAEDAGTTSPRAYDLLSLDKLSYIKREARLASRRQRREFCDAERA